MRKEFTITIKTVIFVSCLIVAIICWKGCTSPADQVNLFNVPEGFVIEPVVSNDLIDYPMFASFDDRGGLFVFESTNPNDMDTDSMRAAPTYQIRLLEDRDQDGRFDRSTIFADKIPFPMGGTFYNGQLYVTAAPDILRMTDTDNDGVADEKEVLLTGWTLSSNGALLSGPFMGPDGWMYVADARRGFDITTKEGERLKGKGARIWRFLPDGSRLEWLSGGGFDNSIEIDFMPSGDPIGTMTYFREPANGQRDALIHWVYGGVYPKPQEVIQEDRLKLTGDLMPVVTKMPRVAPSGIVRFRGQQWGKEYEGDWFSAIFNTGQILRHSITKSGASYASEETAWLTPNQPDVHPTDVLQDANGNLLVVVTGGWFIHGCPLSKVAKPDVKGGIFRIKRVGVPQLKDQWGLNLAMQDMTVEELEKLMEDIRPAVRKKAMESLIKRGDESISFFSKLITSESVSTRLDALFSLHRIGSPEARALVRSGLNDEDADVRIASARLAGLAKDADAINSLIKLVQADQEPAVRRQAATALGQIGDGVATTALLAASKGQQDRFVQHAIRFALITLGKKETLIQALNHPSPEVRETALIVLDQMDNSPLTMNQVRPFLESEYPSLHKAAVWVLTHHSDWSGIMVAYLDQRIRMEALTKDEELQYADLMEAFCGDSYLEEFISRQLSNPRIHRENKKLLLRVVKQCGPPVPEHLRGALIRLLYSDNRDMELAVVDVIETLQIKGTDNILKVLLGKATGDPGYYMKVLSARLQSDPVLSDKEFDHVQQYLDTAYSLPDRRAAVEVLSKSALNTEQLLELVEVDLPKADAVILPGLIRCFAGDSSEVAGMALVTSLNHENTRLPDMPGEELIQILNHYPPQVKTAAEPVLQNLQQRHADRLDQLQNLEANLVKGDVGRGRALFFGKAICSTCHAVGQEGHTFGPDLTNIGEIRSQHTLLEAIVFPSASFAREYETYKVHTSSGTYTGLLGDQMSSGSILLKTAPGQALQISEEDILSMEQAKISLMPTGLDKNLTIQELSDLLAFLQALPYRIDRLIELSE